MPELTIDEKAELRAFIDNEDGSFPELADLPFWWDQTPDAPDPELPNYSQRQILIASYSNWAFTKHWAWEGLRRLLDVLLERGEPVPEILREVWSDPVAAGRREPPSRLGRPDKAERDARLTHAVRLLRGQGFTQYAAMCAIEDAACMPYATVRSAVRRVRKARPFG